MNWPPVLRLVGANAYLWQSIAAATLLGAGALGCGADAPPDAEPSVEATRSTQAALYSEDLAGTCPKSPNFIAQANYDLPTYLGAARAGECHDACGNIYRIYRVLPSGLNVYVSIRASSERFCLPAPTPPPPTPPPVLSACDANPYARCGKRIFHTDDYYDDLNPDVPGDDYQRRIHWVRHGIAEGRPSSLTFHLEVYRSSNPDLARLTGRQLLDHFDGVGLRESRGSSFVFNAETYKALNGDLAHFSNEAAAKHYLSDGCEEGRQANLVFSANAYRAYNPDLAGKSNYELVVHYILAGVNEGRRASEQFSPAAYRARNPDVRGLTNRALVLHYLGYGIREGRLAN